MADYLGLAPPKTRLTNSERTRKCRARRESSDWAAAVAIARIVKGEPPGDVARALAEWLERMADRAEKVPGRDDPDRLDLVRDAAERLRLSRPR